MSKCTECKEYDKERQHCPKWCDVIKGTIEDVRANERVKILDKFRQVEDYEYARWTYKGIEEIINDADKQ